MSDLAQRSADLDERWRMRACPSCGEPTPRAAVACGSCSVEHADHDEMLALIEGVEGASELLGWAGARESESDLEFHPGVVMDREPQFRARAEELGVDLATAAFHWAEGLVDADWIEAARAGAAPETPAARALGRTASELSERAIRDAEQAEARVRRVRATLWVGSTLALVAFGAAIAKLLM